ncbi:helix-turn-helix domain-containing protein [Paenibacillus sacheonensis]|uniref:Helix-turn-helix domain-containing protein n=1 Tax=Paenibacillus sacheonensis TaxID=742054 RepID=A0A7X5C2I0_9BACL|nr:AraC family transcriptional regulator [Paenibacillus sacheonensis]MBM7567602.1 AraC-like DNA-binding protein [Paenibacillus sacheonensis]NBC71295.1 helix-turn-helix domain-containing protein [Paenibacillus sacheonensis]
MNERQSDRGILKAEAARGKFALNRFEPSPDLAPYIGNYWTVRWDLRGQAPYSQTILSYPNINMSFERDHNGAFAGVHGIPKRTYTRHLQDEGEVLGIKFKPGGFYPFWKQPAALLTGGVLALRDIFGEEAREAESRLFAEETDEGKVRIAEAFLRSRLPEPDDNIPLVDSVVQQVIDNRDITKVEDLADMFHLNVRSMQRLFNRYVGVSPKWVIQRFRLQEAAELIEKNGIPDWVSLSQSLGFYDQAHFIKSFKAIVGKSPEEYSRDLGRSPGAARPG